MRLLRNVRLGLHVGLCIAVLVATSAGGEPGDLLWAKRAGGDADDISLGVAAFPDGSSIVVGYCTGTATFGDGEPNETTHVGTPYVATAFVARYGPGGALMWVKFPDSSYNTIAVGASALPDGACLVAGTMTSDATFGVGEPNETSLVTGVFGDGFVARYEADGSLAWARRTGITYGIVRTYGVCAFPDGASMVVGGFFGDVRFGLGEPNETPATSIGSNLNAFVARYRADGTLDWVKLPDLEVSCVAAFPDGSSVAVGPMVTRYEPDGSVAWTRPMYERAPFFLPGSAVANSAAALPDGSTVVTGRMVDWVVFDGTTLAATGPPLAFVARYRADGSVAWARLADGREGHGVAALPDGACVVAGWTQDYLRNDLFVERFDADGALVWVKGAGSMDVSTYGYGVAVSTDQSVVVVGYFEAGTVTFGSGEPNQTTLTAAGNGVDVFVARFGGSQTAQIGAPASIVQECDDGTEGATVNFTFDVVAAASDLLRVRDVTSDRTLVEVAGPADGTYGVGPVTFPHGSSSVVIELLNGGTVVASATVTVQIEDTMPPVISGAASRTIELQGPLTTLMKSLLGITVSDACDPAPTVAFAPAALGLGTTSVTATARDATGNTSTETFDVTVVDTTPPVFTVVPEDVERDCQEGGVLVSFDVLAEDLSGAVDLACEDEDGNAVGKAGTRFDVGEHTVTCTATDASGNTATCSFHVTVVDDDAPVLVLPDDITVGTEPGECFAFVDFDVTATDACDPDAGISCEAPWGAVQSGDAFPVGTTAVTCTARDHSGNEATASFHVTVEDREAPAIACPETATVVMDGSCAACTGHKSCRCGRCEARRHGKKKPRAKCGAATTVTVTAADLGVTATDNCDPDPLVVVSPAELGLGTHAVTVTATDDDGNASSCTVTVTVLRPPLDCQVLRPLDGNVDNRIRAGRTIPIRLKVTCDNVPVRDATVRVDEIARLDPQGTPVANDPCDEDGAADGEFHVQGDRYHRNLSTSDWDTTRGTRYEVILRIEHTDHADSFCSIFFVVR